ncbi:TPA: hypothetical protein ACH3X2_001469 [Trebouxia sp. C0005]
MDRWSGREDDDDNVKAGPQGRVARLGIGAFVKQDADSKSVRDDKLPTGSGKVEVVASRRQQKQTQAAAAMPPPPAKAVVQPSVPSLGVPAPAWAGIPPVGFYLEVQKNGQAVQQIELLNPCTLFGRSANADVVLDHASVSRQHAILCYQTDSNKWVLVDQGSAHGTSVNGRPTVKGVPAQVGLGAKVLFGASTRQYVLQRQSNKQGHLKRSADDDNMQPRKQGRLAHDHAELDRPDTLPLRGQFADVIKSELRPAQTAASPSNPTPAKAQQDAPARTKPDFQKFVSSHLKRPAVGQAGSLYDRLPPEKQTKPMQ